MTMTTIETGARRTHAHALTFPPRRAAFTIIELLTVIGIIAILVAILIPTVGKVRQSANDNRTRALFSQVITAIESYRQEYGYYPTFEYGNQSENVFLLGDEVDIDHVFFTTLTGRQLDGSRIDDQNHPNPRGIQLFSFSESDLVRRGTGQPPKLVDAYGNEEIVIIVDRNQRGVIRPQDLSTVPEVSSVRTPNVSVAPEIPQDGIRAGVLMYSAGAGGGSADNARQNLVRSW